MRVNFVDGLYRVVARDLCAGFVVIDKHVTMCAPILRKRLSYWVQFAQPIELYATNPACQEPAELW